MAWYDVGIPVYAIMAYVKSNKNPGTINIGQVGVVHPGTSMGSFST